MKNSVKVLLKMTNLQQWSAGEAHCISGCLFGKVIFDLQVKESCLVWQYHRGLHTCHSLVWEQE